MATVYDAKIIGLPKIGDERGNLSIIEQFKNIPFEIRRVYWIYDVPGGYNRGEHAYKDNQEFIVALSGAFEVVLDDGNNIMTFNLNRSYFGLYVPKGMWRRMTSFSTNSLALVLSSTDYSECDYIMEYDNFKQWRKDGAKTNDDPPVLIKTNNILEKQQPSVFDCSLFELNKFHDKEGNLTYIYQNVHVHTTFPEVKIVVVMLIRNVISLLLLQVVPLK
jgi:hypothetical protein